MPIKSYNQGRFFPGEELNGYTLESEEVQNSGEQTRRTIHPYVY